MLCIQSVNYTAGLIGCSVNHEVRRLCTYRTFQGVNSFNCSLLDISCILSMEFVARRHANSWSTCTLKSRFAL